MRKIIISDVHLGAKHCRIEHFMRFLDWLPNDVDLVMNGDVVDRWHRALEGRHLEAQERLKEESLKRRVVWVHGNHDDRYELDDPVKIEFTPGYSIGKRLYVSHGFDFDNVMPYHRTFIYLFRHFHYVRVLLGAEPVHVALYAKKFAFLYRVLRKHVAANSVEYAKENGYSAVTCGHTHQVEDVTMDGVRYINTGSWTEPPVYYLEVTDTEINLKEELNNG